MLDLLLNIIVTQVIVVVLWYSEAISNYRLWFLINPQNWEKVVVKSCWTSLELIVKGSVMQSICMLHFKTELPTLLEIVRIGFVKPLTQNFRVLRFTIVKIEGIVRIGKSRLL